MADLKGKHVAVIALDGFERAELVDTVAALREAGAAVDIISQRRGPIRAFVHHDPAETVEATHALGSVDAEAYDALLLPGGALNADALRVVDAAQAFVQAFDRDGKPMAVICHAPWLLASAGIARGRRMTSYHTIADDLRNAGATWTDEEVVVDRNLITSRRPDDIPAFNRAMLDLFGAARTGSLREAPPAAEIPETQEAGAPTY